MRTPEKWNRTKTTWYCSPQSLNIVSLLKTKSKIFISHSLEILSQASDLLRSKLNFAPFPQAKTKEISSIPRM
jgi:hypothetical protein